MQKVHDRLTCKDGASYQLNQLIVVVLRSIVFVKKASGAAEPVGRVGEDRLPRHGQKCSIEQRHAHWPQQDEADGYARDARVLVAGVALDGEVCS